MQTVKQIAQSVGVTPQSVRNEIKKQGIKTAQNKYVAKDKQIRQTIVVADEDAERIKTAILDRREMKEQSKEIAKEKQNKQNNTALFAMIEKELEFKNGQINALQEENKALLEQVAQLNQTVTDLNRTITDLNKTAQQAQALHHEAQQRLEDKRGFFQRVADVFKKHERG